MEGGFRAAGPDTVSAGSADEFHLARFDAQARYLRALTPPKTSPNPPLAQARPGEALGSSWSAVEASGGALRGPGELWEGLEELWKSSGRLYIDKLPINRPSRRYVM